MLLLTRKVGESIIIAGKIDVKVLEISGNQVRIGVAAPHEVTVDREEVHQRKQAEKGYLTK